MSGFFDRLLARSFATPADVLRPKLPSLFEMPAESVPVSHAPAKLETDERTADESTVRPVSGVRSVVAHLAEEEEGGEHEVEPEGSKASAVGRSLRENTDPDVAARRTISPSLAEASYVPTSERRRDMRISPKLSSDDAKDSRRQKSPHANSQMGTGTQAVHGTAKPEQLEPRSSRRPTRSVQRPKMATPSASHVEEAQPEAIFRSNFPAVVLRPAPIDAKEHADVNVLPLSGQSRAVHISIGRVEVRAVTPPAPVQRPTVALARPRMSLDDYLRRRNEGKR